MKQEIPPLAVNATAPSRYVVLAALWGFLVVNYLDRVAISYAGPAIMHSLRLGPDQFGIVLSSFALGYVLSQLPGGLMADRWGARPLLIAAPVLWAIFTGMVGAVSTLAGFVVVRLLFGAAEGLGNATTFKVIADVFPARERGRAASIMMTSFAAGPALAGPLMGVLLASLGWRASFVALAVPALAFAVVNALVIPRQGRGAPIATVPGLAPPAPRLSEVAQSPALWTLAIGYMTFNMAYWGYLGWMPTYLSSAHAIDIKKLGLLGGIPYLFGIAGLLLFGYVGSSIGYRSKPWLFAATATLSALFLFLAFQATGLAMAMAGLSGAALFLYGALSLITALVIESAPAQARATYVSIVTTAGHMGGVIAPAVVGFLVALSGNFASGFAFIILALAVAGLMVATLHRSRADTVPASRAPKAA